LYSYLSIVLLVRTLIDTQHFGNGERCNKLDCWDIPNFHPQTVTQSGRRDFCTVQNHEANKRHTSVRGVL